MRHQKGTIIERSNAFYVRYYTDDSENGSRKVTVKLCNADQDHWSRRRGKKTVYSDSIKQLRDEHMLAVNSTRGTAHASQHARSLTIGEFWKKTFKPSWTDRKLRESTIDG